MTVVVAGLLGVASMTVFIGVSIPIGMLLVALGAGLVVGAVQGWNVQVFPGVDRFLARPSGLGLAAWGAGVVVAQWGVLAARTGAVEVGQAVSWFGIGALGGMLVGRHRRLTADSVRAAARVVGQAASVVAVGAFALVAVVLQVIDAVGAQGSADDGVPWVLESVEVEPPVSDPAWVVVTSTQGTVTLDFVVDPTASVFVSYGSPPDVLVPGSTYTIPVTVTGAVTGGTDTQGYRLVEVLLWENGRQSYGAGAVVVELGCTTHIGTWETTCSEPVNRQGDLTFVAPVSSYFSSEGTYRVSVFVFGRAWAHFDYRQQDTPPVVDPTGPPDDAVPGDVVSGDVVPGDVVPGDVVPGDAGGFDEGSSSNDAVLVIVVAAAAVAALVGGTRLAKARPPGGSIATVPQTTLPPPTLPPPATPSGPGGAPGGDRFSDRQMWDGIGRGIDDLMEATAPPPSNELPPPSMGASRTVRPPGGRSEPEVDDAYGGYSEGGSGKDSAIGTAG